MEIGPTGDFPKNVLEFEERFRTDDACLEYLITLRWSGGFRCPRCGQDRAWRTVRPGLRCAREIAGLAGTMLDAVRMFVWKTAIDAGKAAAAEQPPHVAQAH